MNHNPPIYQVDLEGLPTNSQEAMATPQITNALLLAIAERLERLVAIHDRFVHDQREQ